MSEWLQCPSWDAKVLTAFEGWWKCQSESFRIRVLGYGFCGILGVAFKAGYEVGFESGSEDGYAARRYDEEVLG